MQNILGDTDVEEAIPALHWAKIRRALKPFTYISGIDREIRFIHGAFYQVYICVCSFVYLYIFKVMMMMMMIMMMTTTQQRQR